VAAVRLEGQSTATVNVEDALVCLVVPFSYKATNTTSPTEGEQVEPALKWWVGLVHKIDKSLSVSYVYSYTAWPQVLLVWPFCQHAHLRKANKFMTQLSFGYSQAGL